MIQGVKSEALVNCLEPLTTRKMEYPRLSQNLMDLLDVAIGKTYRPLPRPFVGKPVGWRQWGTLPTNVNS